MCVSLDGFSGGIVSGTHDYSFDEDSKIALVACGPPNAW